MGPLELRPGLFPKMRKSYLGNRQEPASRVYSQDATLWLGWEISRGTDGLCLGACLSESGSEEELALVPKV